MEKVSWLTVGKAARAAVPAMLAAGIGAAVDQGLLGGELGGALARLASAIFALF